MKKIALILFMAAVLAIAAPAQEVFELFRKGDIPAVQALIEKTPELSQALDQYGNSLLHYVAQNGNTDLIGYLADKGAKIDLAGAGKKTPLHLAATYDRSAAVSALLQRKASVDARDDYQRTPLILCAREYGTVETGRILIEAGADINAVDRFGSPALELAAWRGKREFIDLLLEKGAKLPELGERWYMMLNSAATEGLEKLFRPLADKSRDLKSSMGEGLIHAAAAGGSPEIVNYLQQKGYDPSKPDRLGWTPLHYAARDGRAEVVRALIAKGVPLNARTKMGQTAYNVAHERKFEAVASLLAEKGAEKDPLRFPVLEGEYLGQKPPEGGSELFGLGIISEVWGLHTTAIFSPDGNEVYWAPMIMRPGQMYSEGGILMMKRVDGKWIAPELASFSKPDTGDDSPFFSPDRKRVYFLSRRPLPGETEQGSEKIWVSDRTASGWSEPQPLRRVINERQMHWAFSVDSKGTVYFAGEAPDTVGMGDIYYSRLVDGKYETPVNMGKPVNSTDREDCPFVSPDGSYILFARQFDIWASFRDAKGAWSEPVKLGPEVNSPSIDLYPTVTADGKYMFFLSQRDGESYAYWVKADILEKYRPGNKGGTELGQIEQSIRAAIGWAKNKDLPLLYRTVANDPDFLEVHPNGNVVKGFEEFKKAERIWMSPDFKAVRFDISDLKITLSKGGDVAWFYCLLNDINEWKGQPASWENTRWTGVLEKRDGRWILVQQHFSFADKK